MGGDDQPLRIVLLNPPGKLRYQRDGYCSSVAKGPFGWHPLDLLVQSGHLARVGSVVGIDAIARGLSPQQTVRQVAAMNPDWVYVLVGTVSLEEDRALLRQLARATDARFIGSGDLPRFDPERAFELFPELEGILLDFTDPALMAYIAGDPDPSASLLLRSGSRAEARAPVGPMDYPRPLHELFDGGRYDLPFPGLPRFASVLLSYGCPLQCHFCNTGALGFKVRPIESILDEIRHVRARGARSLYLRDAAVNADRGHLLATCQALSQEARVLPWNAFASVTPLDEELVQSMARAGCRLLQIGIESPDEALRRQMGKQVSNVDISIAVETLRDAGIRVSGHFIAGLPGHGREDVLEFSTFAQDVGLDYIAVSVADRRPGSPWARDAAVASSFAGRPSRERWALEAHRRFYLRPSVVLSRVRDLTSVRDLPRLGRAAFHVMRSDREEHLQ